MAADKNSAKTAGPAGAPSRRRQIRRTGGFTLAELMVSMAILVVIVTLTADAFISGVREAMPRLAAVQLLQDSRDITMFMRDSVERAGAGDAFDRNGKQSTFAAAIIPRAVTDANFGLTGPTASQISDGGSSGSDEITLAGSYPISAVVAQDNGAGMMTLTYVPFSRHSSKNSAISYRKAAFQFFNHLYTPNEPSYYYPGLVTSDIGQLMIVRSHGTSDMTGRYRMVRIKGIAPAAAASMPTAYDVTYTLEPMLPFNRWIQELNNQGGSVKYYDSSDSNFNQYAGGTTLGCSDAFSAAAIITGGTADMNNVTPGGTRPQKCTIAAKAFLHTYFINRPTGGGTPQLARYDYTGAAFPAKQDFTVIADGVEDMQVEFFFQSDVTGASVVPGPGVIGQAGFKNPINVETTTSEPEPASVNCIRFMFMIAEPADTQAGSSVANYPPLSNRTSPIPVYNGILSAKRIPISTTYSLKSLKSSQLFGSLGINN